MGRHAVTAYTLTLCLALLPFRTYAIPDETAGAAPAGTESNTSSVLIKTSGLCVGGALLGSFIPVLGSVVGCAIGGISGWFMSRKPATEVASAAPTRSGTTPSPITPAALSPTETAPPVETASDTDTTPSPSSAELPGEPRANSGE